MAVPAVVLGTGATLGAGAFNLAMGVAPKKIMSLATLPVGSGIIAGATGLQLSSILPYTSSEYLRDQANPKTPKTWKQRLNSFHDVAVQIKALGKRAAFDAQDHPRAADGKFASKGSRTKQLIASLPDHVRFGGGANMSTRMSAPSPDERPKSLPGGPKAIGSAWKSARSKGAMSNDIPVSYTGSRKPDQTPAGSLGMTWTPQRLSTDSLSDHMAKVKRIHAIIRAERAGVIERAHRDRKGKKHVYLKTNEWVTQHKYGGVAQWRMKPDLFPEGTPDSTLHRAYNHAAMLAMHDTGIGIYDFKMTPEAKAELTPVIPFIRRARQHLRHQFGAAYPGMSRNYLEEFGETYPNPKIDPKTGKQRHRFKPREQLIKVADTLKALETLIKSETYPRAA
jgi:hypothetical protein